MSKLTTFNMPLGPVHVALEEPVYFNLTVEGETIRKVELTSGHVHRGMEALATQRNLIKNVTLTAEHNTVPSITPLFANADWHEREMMELYGIRVANQPNPRRLFLDEELDAGILNEAVPLSIMMNGACTTDLWERILKEKEGERA